MSSIGFELALAAYSTAAGFVAGGFLSSLYECVTGNRARVHYVGDTVLQGLGSIVFVAFTGPAIVMRNAVTARRVEQRGMGWLAASAAISAVWSFCSGIIVMQVALALTLG